MNARQRNPRPGASSEPPSRWPFWVAAGCGLVLLLGLVLSRLQPASDEAANLAAATPQNPGPREESGHKALFDRRPGGAAADVPAREIVAAKLTAFAESRLHLARARAEALGVTLAPEFEQFFALAAAGNWEALQPLFEQLRSGRDNATEDWWKLWPIVHETYGVAEVVQKWPAQALLDYGGSVLGSLRPGMVYVGGTDAGRFIPTLLNETSGGERHIILTQNALADGAYLDYLRFQHHDRFQALSPEDSQQAFQAYLSDAQRRAQHDHEFPDEPKQLRPGEDVRLIDREGHSPVVVSGQVAVMSINEILLRTLQDKNPNLSFALEESFALDSTYVGARPLGPILELRARDSSQPLTPEQANQVVDYWRRLSESALADPEISEAQAARRAYANMASAQAALLNRERFSAQAQQTYRLARQLAPHSP